MSPSAVNAATKMNSNHSSNQLQKPSRSQHQQPSVQNAKRRLNPTQIEKAAQLSGNHTKVQELDTQADRSNPLHSPQQSIHNQNVVRGGV